MILAGFWSPVPQPILVTMQRLSLVIALVCAALAQWPWQGSQTIVYPPGYNYFNVKNSTLPNGGARGDGITDDSDAIQAAMNATGPFRVLYFPKGVYLISRPLVWPTYKGGIASRSGLSGENVATTTLLLKDSSPQFQNASEPAAMLTLGGSVAQNFYNRVENIGFSTGSRNCGASALRFDANNMGDVRNVSLVSGDPSLCGAVGLDFAYSDQIGPLLAKWVHVRGFSAAVAAAHNVDSQVLEHVWLEGFLSCGVCNYGQVLTVGDLNATTAAPGAVPVVSASNEPGDAAITIVGAVLGNTGVAPLPCGVNSTEGLVFVRNLSLVGAFDFAIVHSPPQPPPPPPPPSPGCNASLWAADTAGNGDYLTQSTQPSAATCCAAAVAFNTRAPPAPCVLWTWAPPTCYLHSTSSVYRRGNTTSGALNSSATSCSAPLSPPLLPWPNCGVAPPGGEPVQCVNGSYVAEWTSAPVVRLFPTAPNVSLGLAVATDPEPAWPEPSAWAPALAADASGAVNCSLREDRECSYHGGNITCWLPDCSALLQSAMDAAAGNGSVGALFFPAMPAYPDSWFLYADVSVPSGVTRLNGGGASVQAPADTQASRAPKWRA